LIGNNFNYVRERLSRLRAEEERKEREELEHQKKLQTEKNIISRLQLEFPTFALDMIRYY
jgi:hypothetical protein